MTNARGSSLLLLTVLIGILAIASHSWMQLASNHLKNVKTKQTRSELDAFESQLRVFLSAEGVCTTNLSNTTPGSLGNVKSLSELVDANGVSRFSTGSSYSYGNETLQIKTIKYGGSKTEFFISSDAGNRATSLHTYFRFPLQIELENKSSTFGSNSRTIELEISASFDNNRLDQCQLKMDGGNSFWQTADDSTNQLFGINTTKMVGLSDDLKFKPDALFHIQESSGRSFYVPSTDVENSIAKSTFASTTTMISTTDKVETGTFELLAGADTLARVRLTSSNEDSASFKTGVRSDIVKARENKAAAFSLFKSGTLENDEDDNDLRARIRFGYWENNNTFTGAQARIFNSSGTSNPQAIAYLGAKVSGTYYGGHFEGAVGFRSTACSACSVIAEMMEVEEEPHNGTVMCINRKSGMLKSCDHDKSSSVIGIAQENAEILLRRGCSETLKKNGENGMIVGPLNTKGWRTESRCKGWYPIAMAGVSEKTHVLCQRPDGSLLQRGDILVTSGQTVGLLRALDHNEEVLDFQIAGRAMDECAKNSDGKTAKRDVIDVLVKYK